MSEMVDRRTYLLLLQDASTSGCKEAYERLRAMGLRVPIQHGETAMEILATPDEAEAAAGTGLFSACLKGQMKKEHMTRLDPGQADVVASWNQRMSAAGLEASRSRPNEGVSWGDPRFEGLVPYTAIDPAAFAEVLEKYGLAPTAAARRMKRIEGAALGRFQRTLATKLGDPKLARHLAALSLHLPPAYRQVMEQLPPEAVRELSRLATSGGQEGR
jgi:hypothetical protein